MFKSICHVVVQLFIQTWSTNVFWSFEQTCDQLILLKIHLFFLQRILFPKSCKFNLCKYSHYISWTSFLWLWKPTGWMHACVHTHTHTVPKSCWTICDPVDCSPPGSSVQGIFQARILEWVAISSSKGSSWIRDRTYVSFLLYLGRWIFYHWATWKALSSLSWMERIEQGRRGKESNWFLSPMCTQSPHWWECQVHSAILPAPAFELRKHTTPRMDTVLAFPAVFRNKATSLSNQTGHFKWLIMILNHSQDW